MVFAVTVMITNIFDLPNVWNWFNKYHATRASISMSNVVVNPNYLNIANMPDNLKQHALEITRDIPSEAYWPEGSYHAEEFEYQTGIDDIRKGLSNSTSNEVAWRHFIQYTKDLDRLRSTNTFKHLLDKDLLKELEILNLKLDKIESNQKLLLEKLGKHIDFIDETYEGLRNPIQAAKRFLGKR